MIPYTALEVSYRFNRFPGIFDRFCTVLFGAILLSKIDESNSELQLEIEEVNQTLVGVNF